jgi:uncharacterized protein (TIGR01777 family)
MVIVFTRDIEKSKAMLPKAYKHIEWDAKEEGAWKQHLEECDYVIHLAGEPLFANRWSEDVKKRIYNSRIISTRGLVKAMREGSHKPSAFLTSSAIGYYGSDMEKEFTESDPPGNSFLARVCRDWEGEAAKCAEFGVRWAGIRSGIALDKHDGALAKMIPFFKAFLGGPIGNPKNYWSWISLEDLADLYMEAMNNPEYKGALNGVSPNPATGKEFARELGRAMRRPSLFPVPEDALKLVFGEKANAISGSQKVLPKKALDLGFKFKYPNLPEALKNALE